jgi:hypothetical protein
VGDKEESLSAGAVDLPVPLTSVTSPSGKNISFAQNGDGVHFFAGESGQYHIAGPGGSGNLMVNMPALPTGRWTAVTQETAAIETESAPGTTRDLWRWLLGLALIALWLEWQLFYMLRQGREERHSAKPSPTTLGGWSPGARERADEEAPSILKAS